MMDKQSENFYFEKSFPSNINMVYHHLIFYIFHYNYTISGLPELKGFHLSAMNNQDMDFVAGVK